MSVQSAHPVGITKGPGETIHEFTFISRDEQRVLKNGEYVYYELEAAETADGARGAAPRQVLGRIQHRVPVQLYPDTFLSEPQVAPAQVAALVGYDQRASDLFEMHVAIMGYYDGELGTFVNPWIPPSSGTPIYLPDAALLADVLSRTNSGGAGRPPVRAPLTPPPPRDPVALHAHAPLPP